MNLSRDQFPYAPFYCEENVYKLLGEPLVSEALQDCRPFVLVVSNVAGAVAMQDQRARPDDIVYWDYHVLLLALDSSGGTVFDLDSTRSFPESAAVYLDTSFPHTAGPTAPWFKCLAADYYLAHFCSDRRHMRDAQGSYLAPPPDWPPIRPDQGSNLAELIDMRHALHGCPRSLQSLRAVL
jgi:hypothetical protein